MHLLRVLGTAFFALLLLTAVMTSASAHTGDTGDVNCDDDINSIDSSLILQYGAGLINELECAIDADVNNDTQINSIDSTLILQYTAGLISSL